MMSGVSMNVIGIACRYRYFVWQLDCRVLSICAICAICALCALCAICAMCALCAMLW